MFPGPMNNCLQMCYNSYAIFLVCRVCPDGVDVVLDSQGGEECNRGYTLLKPLGRYILFGNILDFSSG